MTPDQSRAHQTSPDEAEARRIITTLTGPLERRWLPVLAAQLPSWTTPDMLTVSGMIVSAMIGGLYALSGRAAWPLWIINILFVVHWYTDSLDGSVARLRKIERPHYGFFIDHAADAVAALCICLGLGLSPHMDLRVACGLLLSYYLMMIVVLLRAYTLREFKISYGLFGPTELRILLILANTGLWIQITWFSSDRLITVFGVPVRLLDVLAIVAGTIMTVTFIGTFLTSLRRLAVIEPPGVRQF